MDACLKAGVSYLDTANYGILTGTVPASVRVNRFPRPSAAGLPRLPWSQTPKLHLIAECRFATRL